MRAQPVDLIGGFYKDDSLPWSAQDTVNWLPVQAEVSGTRSVSKLSTPPGLKPWLVVGEGPIRGMHDLEGARFVVSGQTLCRINPNKSVDPLGTIPGVGRVQMTHNQFKTGFQLLIENGQGGGGYVYDTTANTFAKITDEGYPGSISSDYLDSYILGVEPQGRFWFHSNLADATDYNTLDRYEAEASPDRIVGLAANASEVVVFGQRTVEFFLNTGNATNTFQNRGSAITRGCASRHSIQKLDNTLFWLGNDGVVYRLEGYLARPISTRPLEKAISDYNWPEAIAYVWEDRGHKVYYLTFPDGLTFGYDVITGLWHRRESYGMNRWRLSYIIPWGRDWFGGDFQSGRIWQLDWDYILEGDQPLVRRRVSPVAADNQSAVINPQAELVFDVGRGPETEALAFPESLSLSGSPPWALIGLSYPNFSFTTTGGAGPYTYSIVRGQLPDGLALSSGGAITGTPTEADTETFTVRVFDSAGRWDEQSYTIKVSAGKLALAVPEMFYTGGYDSLIATSRVTARTPYSPQAFSISPNAGYAYVGLTAAPFGVLCKYNADAGVFGESGDITFAPTAPVRACHFSPDGLHLAMVTGTDAEPSVLRVMKIESGVWTQKSTATLGTFSQCVRFSPDGKKIAAGQSSSNPNAGIRLFVFDPATSTLGSFVTGGPTFNAQSPNDFGFSPDSRYIAEWSNNSLNIRTAFGTSSAVVSNSELPSACGAVFSQDGKFVYTVGSTNDKRITAYPVSDGVLGTPVTLASPYPVNFSPSDSSISGSYLAVARFGNVPAGMPPVMLFIVNGTGVQVAPNQPDFSPVDAFGAVEWTI